MKKISMSFLNELFKSAKRPDWMPEDGDRLYVMAVADEIGPRETKEIYTTTFEWDFKLRNVVIPNDLSVGKNGDPRLFFHHKGISFGGKCVASLVFLEDLAGVQDMGAFQSIIYPPPERRYAAGSKMRLGVFENVSDDPLKFRAGVLGYVSADAVKELRR